MKVLITGGAGFVGSHAAEHFAKKGVEVVVFDNLARANMLGKGQEWSKYNWEYLRTNYRGIRLVEGDIRSLEQVKDVTRGCDLIIHTAAQVAVTSSLNDPITDFTVNALGTLNVLEAARTNDSALIFCSTNKVYGDGVNEISLKDLGTRYWYDDPAYQTGIPETFPIDHTVHTPYGCSKLAADIYVQDYGKVYGLRTVVFRMSCIYGERQFGVEDQGWLAHFIKQAITDESITIYGDGKQVRDVLHVDDLVKAMDAAYARSDRLKGEAFNIGGGLENAVSLLEAIEYISELVKKKIEVRFSDWRPADQKVYVSDIRKAMRILDWQPSVGWRVGIRRTYEWMKNVLME